jgi:DNA-binding NarL/FixJ family response regulator
MSDRVLVIIDDPFELSSVGAALKLHGVPVIGEAGKKSTAINLFRSLQPNVVLLDMHKSNESSIEIAQLIRQESPWVGVVILVPCADMRLIGEDLLELPVGALLVLKNSLNNLSVLCEAISASRSFNEDMQVAWVNGAVTMCQKESKAFMSGLSNTQIETLSTCCRWFNKR